MSIKPRKNPDATDLSFVSSVDTGESNPVQRETFRLIKKYLTNKKVLDVGCWTGGFETQLKNCPGSFYAVEPSPDAIRVARQNSPQVIYKQGSVFRIPFADNTFDVVMFWLVLEHIPRHSEIKALQEMRRVLKPGGFLFVSTPFFHPLANVLDISYPLKGHRHYSWKKIEKLLQTSGFKLETGTVLGGFWYASSVLALYFFKHLGRRPVPEKMKLWFEEKVTQEFRRGRGFHDMYFRAKKI